MIFWVREIMGWTLLLLGLGAMWFCYSVLIRGGKPLDAVPTAAIGIFLFQGGIHFLKVAVAARICQQPEPKPVRPATSARIR
jgi:hypothetical protein